MKKKMKVVKVLKPEEITDSSQKVTKKSLRVKDDPNVTKDNLIVKMNDNMRTEIPAEFLGQDITLGGMISAFKDKFGDELTLAHFTPLSTNLNPMDKVVPLPLITPYNDIYKESSRLANSDDELLGQLFMKVLHVNQDLKEGDPRLEVYNQLFKNHYNQTKGYKNVMFQLRCQNLAYQFAQSFIACAEDVMHTVYSQYLKENNIDIADLFKNEKVLNNSYERIVYIFGFTFSSLLEYGLDNLNYAFCIAGKESRYDKDEEEMADFLDRYYSQSIIPHAINIGIMELYNFIEDNIIKFINNSAALSTYKGIDIERLFEDMICALYPLFDSTRTNLLRTMQMLRNEFISISFTSTDTTDPMYNYTKDDTFSKIIARDFNMYNIEKVEEF